MNQSSIPIVAHEESLRWLYQIHLEISSSYATIRLKIAPLQPLNLQTLQQFPSLYSHSVPTMPSLSLAIFIEFPRLPHLSIVFHGHSNSIPIKSSNPRHFDSFITESSAQQLLNNFLPGAQVSTTSSPRASPPTSNSRSCGRLLLGHHWVYGNLWVF